MTDSQPCDFCGKPVIWNAHQIKLDADLKKFSHCNGLGVMCDDCDDAMVQIAIDEEERDMLARLREDQNDE